MQAKCGGGAGMGHSVRLRLQRTQASTGIPFCSRLQRPGWKGRAMLLVRVLPSVAFVAAMLRAATLAADAAETANQTAQIDLTQMRGQSAAGEWFRVDSGRQYHGRQ